MTYRCDTCDVPLPPGYTPQVDHRGRPCLAICVPCNAEMVTERSRRLGLTRDLLDEFEEVLQREILPRMGN